MKIDAVALVDILKREKESYQELLELAGKQQELIVARDIEELSEVLRATERLIARVQDLEEQRLLLLNVDDHKHSPESPRTLSSLIDTLDDAAARETPQLRNEIIALIEDLNVANNTNAELVYRSIGYVDFLLETMMNDSSPCYRHKDTPQNSRPWLFDGRA